MEFNLQTHLDKLSESTVQDFVFPDDFANWQNEFRLALAEVLRITGRIPAEIPQVTLLSSEDKGSYTEEKYFFMLDGVPAPMYLLVPKGDPPYPAMLAFHGHGIGVKHILGEYPDEDARQIALSRDGNFAQRFAEDGYLVCAIEQRGFGERVTGQITDNGYSCRHLSFEYMMNDRTVAGERVRDAIAAINYLLSREDIIKTSLYAAGHSGGSTTLLFLAALDTRISHSILSGYFCDYKYSILGVHHCECNYIPAISTLGSIGDIASLITPRHMLFINGDNDPIFPLEGFQKAYARVKQAYDLSQEEDRLSTYLHSRGHAFDYAAAIEWSRKSK